MYGLTVYTPDMDCICRWCSVQFPATAVLFALFDQILFLAPLLTELFLCSLFYKRMFFAFINSFIGSYGS
jgi:hypothetical protein